MAAAAIGLALIVEHHVVAGFDRQQIGRRLRIGAAMLVVIALSAFLLPVGGAQSAGAPLPDLISDPPRPSFFKELNTEDGTTRLVVTFDGYVHNIGDGALDLFGNPQDADGMKQRVRNGDEWEIVGAPTVRYETDDGHNHFHLIEAIEYVLWNELQGTQTAVGSKVGFCLVDSQQMEPLSEQAYTEDGDKFCQEGNPGATKLRMGISPGWRDIYDATTTLQWVDVSNVAPGRYWIGAITDPNDEILESNEDNNEVIFSRRTISVPGFSPRAQRPAAVNAGVADITLAAWTHGTVTTPIYVIEQGPSSGELNVPVGADLGSPHVRYFPEPGFEGMDQIVFSVRDQASPYPFDAPKLAIDIEVSPGEAADGNGVVPNLFVPTLTAPSTFFETSVGAWSFEKFDVASPDVTATGDNDARLFASGLPAGLVADPVAATISGIPLEGGIFDVELTVLNERGDASVIQNVSWIVNAADVGVGLGAVADQSTPRGELTRLRVGPNALGVRFEATGLPPGLALEVGAPVIAGSASEVGDYQVTVKQFNGDDVVTESAFQWTIRPTVDIDFAL